MADINSLDLPLSEVLNSKSYEIDELNEQANASLDRIETHIGHILKENKKLKLEIEIIRSQYKRLQYEYEFLQETLDEEE